MDKLHALETGLIYEKIRFTFRTLDIQYETEWTVEELMNSIIGINSLTSWNWRDLIGPILVFLHKQLYYLDMYIFY